MFCIKKATFSGNFNWKKIARGKKNYSLSEVAFLNQRGANEINKWDVSHEIFISYLVWP